MGGFSEKRKLRAQMETRTRDRKDALKLVLVFVSLCVNLVLGVRGLANAYPPLCAFPASLLP